MKSIITFFITVNLMHLIVLGQNPVSQYLEINQVRASYSNNNMMFWDQQGAAKYEVPKGSGKTSLFSHSLWIGGIDANGQLHLAAHKYLQTGQDFYPGPIYTQGVSAGSCDSALSYQYNNMWTLNNYDIQEFKYRFVNNYMSGYIIPNSILTWPANGAVNCDSYLAPFYDYNGDAYYNPYDGDYPIIKGDQMLYWVFNDNTKPHTETGSLPLGVEVRCMAYEFACDSLIQSSNGVLNYTTFLTYQIINRSTNTYHDSYIGLFTDGDLGDGNDDYLGFNLEKNAYYFYNGKTIDGTGQPQAYGANPPAQSVVLLQGPLKDADGIDDLTNWNDNNILRCDSGFRYNSISGHKEYISSGDILNGSINGFNFGDGIIDNEKLGFTRLTYFNNGACPDMCDPQTGAQHYNYLSGKWKDGTPFIYGGTGHALTGTISHFVYPANSDLCNYSTGGNIPPAPTNPLLGWCENGEGNPYGDRRGLGSIGPITLNPGQIVNIDLAFVWSRDSVGGNVLNKLFNDIDIVKNMYDNGNLPSCQYPINVSVSHNNNISKTAKIYPTITNSILNIELDIIQSENFQYSISNIQGIEIIKGDIIEKLTKININNINQGLYIIKIYSNNNIWTNKFIKMD